MITSRALPDAGGGAGPLSPRLWMTRPSTEVSPRLAPVDGSPNALPPGALPSDAPPPDAPPPQAVACTASARTTVRHNHFIRTPCSIGQSPQVLRATADANRPPGVGGTVVVLRARIEDG